MSWQSKMRVDELLHWYFFLYQMPEDVICWQGSKQAIHIWAAFIVCDLITGN